MKKFVMSALLAVSPIFASSALAGHMPSVDIKIVGAAAKWVEPQLFFKGEEDGDALPLFQDRGLFIYDDATAGEYTLHIVDKKTGYVILREPISATEKGHHLENAFRYIDCSVVSGEITCLNLL